MTAPQVTRLSSSLNLQMTLSSVSFRSAHKTRTDCNRQKLHWATSRAQKQVQRSPQIPHTMRSPQIYSPWENHHRPSHFEKITTDPSHRKSMTIDLFHPEKITSDFSHHDKITTDPSHPEITIDPLHPEKLTTNLSDTEVTIAQISVNQKCHYRSLCVSSQTVNCEILWTFVFLSCMKTATQHVLIKISLMNVYVIDSKNVTIHYATQEVL